MKHSNDFSYADALEFIHGSLKLGSKLGLANIRALLERVGRPQDSLKFVHIAGTNGKGTVTSSLAAVLSCAGYKTGAYTSPFVYRFNERIQIDGAEVSDTSLAKNAYLVKKACEAMVEEGFHHPTEFEIVTAIGLLCFQEAGCKFVALEVGLGGRLDATNVIENPLCIAICCIGYDHMQYLGNTLSEIAAEKCGILKEGVEAVVYAEQPKEALSVILEACAKKNATVRMAKLPKLSESTYLGNTFSAGHYKDLFLPLAGEHMAKNACVTLEIIEVLREKGVNIPDEAVYKGFARVRHRGRLEAVSQNPLFILDGAHNDDGIAALTKAAKTLFPGKKIVGITGMLADKEYQKAMEKIGGLFKALITVTVPSPRALPAEDLAKVAMPYHKHVQAADSMAAAIRLAHDENPDVILAFGSLYMLSNVKNALDDYKKDRAEYKRLTQSDYTVYTALTKTVLESIPNPDWFMPLSNQQLATIFAPHSPYVVHGCFVDGILAGASLFDTCREEFLEVAKAAEVDPEKKGAELGISMVLPAYRGQNIMFQLNSSLKKAAKEMGFDYLLATAHPENLASNASLRKLGMTYKKTIIRQGHYARNVYFMAL